MPGKHAGIFALWIVIFTIFGKSFLLKYEFLCNNSGRGGLGFAKSSCKVHMFYLSGGGGGWVLCGAIWGGWVAATGSSQDWFGETCLWLIPLWAKTFWARVQLLTWQWNSLFWGVVGGMSLYFLAPFLGMSFLLTFLAPKVADWLETCASNAEFAQQILEKISH